MKLSEDKKREIGREVCDLIDAGILQRGNVDWWIPVEKAYRNEAPEGDDMFGNKPGSPQYKLFHVPFSQPRQDALTAQVCTVVSKQDPIMVARIETNEDQGVKRESEKILHDEWVKAEFPSHIRKASTISTNTNKAIIQIVPGETSAVEFFVIHPENFVRYPAVNSPDPSRYVGKRIYLRRKVIEDRIKNGTYFKVEVPNDNADPEEYEVSQASARSGASLRATGTDRKDDLAETWEGVSLLDIDGTEKLYLTTVSYTEKKLLKCDPYPYSEDWFAEAYYIADEAGYWPTRSVGRNLCGLQDLYNKLHSALYTGAMSAAKPAIWGPELDQDKQFQYWNDGEYKQTDDPQKLWHPQITFRGEAVNAQIQNVERLGDQVARISQQTMGAQTQAGRTATSDSIVAQGVAIGIEEYMGNFTQCLKKLARLTVEYVNERGDYQIDPKIIWQPSGESPANSPQAKVQSAMMLVQLSQDPAFGYDKYALGKTVLANSSLGNTDGIQIPKELMGMQEIEKIIVPMLQSGITVQQIAEGLKQVAMNESQQAGGLDGGGGMAGMGGIPPEQAFGGGQEAPLGAAGQLF